SHRLFREGDLLLGWIMDGTASRIVVAGASSKGKQVEWYSMRYAKWTGKTHREFRQHRNRVPVLIAECPREAIGWSAADTRRYVESLRADDSAMLGKRE